MVNHQDANPRNFRRTVVDGQPGVESDADVVTVTQGVNVIRNGPTTYVLAKAGRWNYMQHVYQGRLYEWRLRRAVASAEKWCRSRPTRNRGVTVIPSIEAPRITAAQARRFRPPVD